MDSSVSGFAEGLSNALSQYMQMETQMGAQQRLAKSKSDQELEQHKKEKLYDVQLEELRDITKNDRDTLPFSTFQGKGIEEAEAFPPDTRVKISDALQFLKDKSKDKKDANASSINQLRGDFLQSSKSFAEVGQSMQRIINSAQDPSAAGDLSMIFAYMKLLDPTSVVREGEQASAQNAGSVPQSIIAQYNKVLNGERLSSDMRNDFVNRGVKLFRGQESLQRQRKGEFSNLAVKQGIDPETVTFNIPTPPTFDSEVEASRAKGLKSGSYIIIGDRLARVK